MPPAVNLSPVFEEMLAHQIYALSQNLIPQKKSTPEPFFLVTQNETGNALLKRTSAKLKTLYPAVSWKEVDLSNEINEKSFQSLVFIGFDWLSGSSSKNSVVNEINQITPWFQNPGNKGFILVVVREYMNRGWLDSIAEDTGLKVFKVMALRELEFVEDGLGREIVNLDLPQFRESIYERFVREGMNPVDAHLKTDQAIEQFRACEWPQIVVFANKNA